MNKRGFTLVELLSVVIILSLLIAFVLPQITNSVRNYQGKTDEVTTKLIIDAAKLYVEDNSNKYPKKTANTYCITMNELIENDYLKNKIKLNDVDVTDSKSVQVTYDISFNYKLVDASECIYYNPICEPVTSSTVTTGNIPEGNFEAGDEYICEVKSGVKHHFFVLNRNNDTISLIMNRNICEDGGVAIESNTCLIEYNSFGDASRIGPVTAIDYLNNATNSWNNIINLNITYDDEGTNFNSFEIIGKARLPYRSEVGYSNGNNEYLYGYLDGSMWNGIEDKRPINNISGIKGYWTFSSNKDNSSKAYYVNYGGSVSGNGGISSHTTNGVRPVIEINRGNLPVCTLISGDKNTNGSKYECEVKPGVKYNFFVISQNEDGTTNLIMERNICEDGTVADESNLCLVAWVSKADYNDDTNYGNYGNTNKGPITAMNFVHNATKDWINIPNMVMNYEDENINYNTQEKGTYGYGYGTIVTTNNKTQITKKDEIVTAAYTNLKARLPMYEEVHGVDKCLTYAENGNQFGRCPLYLVNYLESNSEYETVEGLQNISRIQGYWTLSSNAINSSDAWDVNCYGTVNLFNVSDGSFYVYYGVRPVITLKL